MGQTQAQRYALFSTPPNICLIFSSLFFRSAGKDGSAIRPACLLTRRQRRAAPCAG